MKSQTETQLALPVTLIYETLPEMLVNGSLLPKQIEITHVLVEIPSEKGKLRKINLLKALDESTIMLLEDEVLDT